MMAKYIFHFSNQVNFEAKTFSNVHQLLTFLEDENERLKVQGQSASFALQKIDKNGKVIANFERIDFPIDVWDEELFEPLYAHNVRYLKKHPELASIIISEKPQNELEHLDKAQHDVSLSKSDENWEQAFLEASEKELLEQNDEPVKEEAQSLTVHDLEVQESSEALASEPIEASTINDEVSPVISNKESVNSYSDAAQETAPAASEVINSENDHMYSEVVEKLSKPLAVPDIGMDSINILEQMATSDDPELSQLLSEISSFVDQKLTSYTSKLEHSTNQELESIDRREEIKKVLLEQCSELTQTQIQALTEQLAQEKARAISEEQTRHHNELARIESDFNRRLAQEKQKIEVTNLSNTQKEIEKSQSEIASTLSHYAKTKAEQNHGKLQLMKSKLQEAFSSIFTKNINKEEIYHKEILSKFPTHTAITTPDEGFKIPPLDIAQLSTEHSSTISSQKHSMAR
ncbi:hypothetical protein [Lactococcus lactis]